MIIHIYFTFPETAGKTLEEVEGMFLSGVPAWKTKVQYASIRRAEMGDTTDTEKRLSSVGHHESSSEGNTTTETKV